MRQPTCKRETYQANAIYHAMLSANKTMARLHRETAFSMLTIKSWLDGTTYPSKINLAKLAAALGVSESFIATGGEKVQAAPPVTGIKDGKPRWFGKPVG
jgi:transcriptional regulator with XRE-family HTH domain